jgi:hypothetical protein
MKPLNVTSPAVLSASLLALSLMAHGAHAAIMVNNSGANPPCNVNEVTLAPVGQADYCLGYFSVPSSPGSEQTLLNNRTDGGDFSFVYKVEEEGPEGTGLWETIKFTLTASTFDDDNGTWTISWVDTDTTQTYNLPLYVDLAVAFKAGAGPAGGGIAYFLFDDFLLTSDTLTRSGTFDLKVDLDLSHSTLFVRLGTDPDDPDDPGDIPEPGVLFLMGAGLLGLGMARRRKSA